MSLISLEWNTGMEYWNGIVEWLFRACINCINILWQSYYIQSFIAKLYTKLINMLCRFVFHFSYLTLKYIEFATDMTLKH